MNKSKAIISSLLLFILGFVFFFFTKSFANLAFTVCAFGMLLSAFGESRVSRTLMIIGGLGFIIFGIWSIISTISFLI